MLLLPSLTVLAPAKLNLHLSVVGRRADGYHFLETFMVKVDLTDRLTLVRRAGGVRLRVMGADLPEDEGNLVFRAAQAFFQAAGLKSGVDMVLEKKIPLAAGLGGGSSDAAATLLGLNEMFDHPLDRESLAAMSLNLGADIPFFLYPGSAAWVKGIGEEVYPGPFLPAACFLLINPGWPLSTAWVYNNFKLKLTNRKRNHINLEFNERSFTKGSVLFNDLETVVLPRYPEIALIKERLISAGAVGALMTGSGPTVFGVFPGQSELDRACGYLKREGRDHWIILKARLWTGAESALFQGARST